ncbi:MAG: hypothetical protein JWO83_2840 [Caulobacteraceae bacterium]|nr:hypothetical protein [Caulobacteraceae bacterium]
MLSQPSSCVLPRRSLGDFALAFGGLRDLDFGGSSRVQGSNVWSKTIGAPVPTPGRLWFVSNFTKAEFACDGMVTTFPSASLTQQRRRAYSSVEI